MKPQTNNDGYSYWSYMLVYVNDCLAVHHDPGPVMEALSSCYKLKNDTYGEPKKVFRSKCQKISVTTQQGKFYWSMHAYKYVVESCKMVQGWSERDGRKFNNKHEDGMKGNYCPKIRYI